MSKISQQMIRVGARGSRLSQIQAQSVMDRLQRVAPEAQFKLVVIKTSGDLDRHSSLQEIGGGGVFIKELEVALERGDIDLAVHSAKDLPSRLAAEFCLVAVPERAPVEDVLISTSGETLGALPSGARVATGSPRRRALLRRYRSDLQFLEVRGNVDSRLRKLHHGEFDALVLARAGLQRLGLENQITEVLPSEDFLPAPGQGTLALEMRRDHPGREVIVRVDSPLDHACLLAERALLEALQVGCSTPLGGWARWEGDRLRLDAIIFSADLVRSLSARGEVDNIAQAERLGRQVADDLLHQGAGEFIA